MTKDEALKLALEAYLCREMPAGTVIGDPKWWVPKIANAIKKALAQPEQEPVGWLTDDEREAFERFNETCEDGEGYDVPKTMMRRLAEIGVIHHTSRGIYGITKFGRSLVGYTTPPQRTWVGLTDEQKEILNFLLGASDIDDAWFGDKHPTEKGQFWWRNRLRKAFQEAAHGIKGGV